MQPPSIAAPSFDAVWIIGMVVVLIGAIIYFRRSDR